MGAVLRESASRIAPLAKMMKLYYTVRREHMRYFFWGFYFILLLAFALFLAIPALGHEYHHYQPSPILTPPNKECEGGDYSHIVQLCPTEEITPTGTPEATLTPLVTPELTASPSETPQPASQPQSPTATPQPEQHDTRLAPESLPMPEDKGIDK